MINRYVATPVEHALSMERNMSATPTPSACHQYYLTKQTNFQLHDQKAKHRWQTKVMKTRID